MAATVRGAIRELLEQTMVTIHVLTLEQDSLKTIAADRASRTNGG